MAKCEDAGAKKKHGRQELRSHGEGLGGRKLNLNTSATTAARSADARWISNPPTQKKVLTFSMEGEGGTMTSAIEKLWKWFGLRPVRLPSTPLTYDTPFPRLNVDFDFAGA